MLGCRVLNPAGWRSSFGIRDKYGFLEDRFMESSRTDMSRDFCLEMERRDLVDSLSLTMWRGMRLVAVRAKLMFS
jgi:hypothetical protein